MKNIYEGLYSNQKHNILDNIRVKIMVRLADELNLNQRKILDIGCYDGTFLSLLKNRNNFFYGIEASNYGVKKSLEKGIKVKKFFFNDKDKIPFRGGSFDLIVAGEIIEHIFDTDFFLEEIRRLLKPRGWLILSTPNLASFGRRLMLFLGGNPIIELSPNEPQSSGHIRYFTKKGLFDLLLKCGFRVCDFRSDVINLTPSGKLRSYLGAQIFKTLGQSLIVVSQKE